MQKCLNCDAQITCSCKRRHATDGKLVCVNCIADYEKKLVELKEATSNQIEDLPLEEDKKDT